MATLRKIFTIGVVAFILGLCFGAIGGELGPWLAFFLFLALVYFVAFAVSGRGKIFLFVAIFCLGLCLGLGRWLSLDLTESDVLTCSVKSPCSGLVLGDPDRRDRTTRLSFLPEGREERLLIITDNFVDYRYGDRLSLVGKIETPKNFLTDEGRVFDYQNYLLVRGITKISYQPKITILSRGEGFFIKSRLFALKHRFLRQLQRVLPEPSASLAGGLILGDKGGLGDKVAEQFRQAGVSHIVVLSGYNITIVAESVLKFFAWLALPWSSFFGLIAIFIFVVMVGAEAAIVRAALMGSIALLARHFGRTYDAGRALVAAGSVMVAWNPRLLFFDLGFQLSFLATLGLIYLAPLVDKFFAWLARRRPTWFRLGCPGFLREIIVTTSGAQLAVYPWLLFKTGNATLIGFVSNVFVLPAVPMAMLFSFLTGLAGFLSSGLALILSYPTYFFLAYILKVAAFFAII